MVLSPGHLDDTITLYNTTAQTKIQVAFVLLMVISIPWMLIPKVFLLKRQYYAKLRNEKHLHHSHELDVENKGKSSAIPQLVRDESEEKIDPNKKHQKGHSHDEEFDTGEVFIHQLIHTIEYVLGTVSNTASYLRLWALSLAHAQLSEVFYSKTLESSLHGNKAMNVIESVLTCFLFLMFTLGVLMLMDVMECFLHALRLHWVEFQSKFFYADGIPFEPFTYSQAIKEN